MPKKKNAAVTDTDGVVHRMSVVDKRPAADIAADSTEDWSSQSVAYGELKELVDRIASDTAGDHSCLLAFLSRE